MSRSPTTMVAVSAVILLLASSSLRAQSVTLEADVGIQFPFGRLADSVSAGPAGGVGIGHQLRPRVGLALRGEISRLTTRDRVVPGGPEGPAPGLTHWQFVAEGRFRPVRTTGSANLVLSGGAGVAVFRFAGAFLDERFRSTRAYPTVRGGAVLELDVNRRVALTAATRVKLVLSEQEDPPVPPFDETWFLNLTVGGRISP